MEASAELVLSSLSMQLRPKTVTSSWKAKVRWIGPCTALLLTPYLASPQAQQTNPPQSAPEPKIKFAQTPYQPITGRQRVKWVLVSPFEPENLLRGLFSAGLGTASNTPREYGPHWDGFAKRYGMRFTGVITSKTMEAGLGAIWGEDPRYVPARDKPFRERIGHIFVMTVMATRRDGQLRPAYARFIAYPSSNFLSNTWRVDSVSDTSHALARTGYGFLGKIATNTLKEFWPDAKKNIFKR
jgi:hypothetical protein